MLRPWIHRLAREREREVREREARERQQVTGPSTEPFEVTAWISGVCFGVGALGGLVLKRGEVRMWITPWEGRYNKATWKREFKLPWREAGPSHHLDDKLDSAQ